MSRRTARLKSAVPATGLRPRRNTTSTAGKPLARWRKASRAWRFTALRKTASRNNRFGTTIPSRGAGSACWGSNTPTSRSNHIPLSTRRREKTSANSAGRRRRWAGRNRALRVWRTGSDREAVATLGASRADHRTAATGAHAYEEAMGALATHDGRLVSTFHDLVPRKKGKPWITPSSASLVKKFRHLPRFHGSTAGTRALWITFLEAARMARRQRTVWGSPPARLPVAAEKLQQPPLVTPTLCPSRRRFDE